MPKTLIAYYSAQGHTKRLVELAARVLEADMFEIQPKQAYSEEDFDYNNPESRVMKEERDPSLRDIELIKETPDNLVDYERVLICYPIWAGIAAWPVNRFVKNNDFSGKTVGSFCTSTSSPLGDSDILLYEMNRTGDWLDGKRFPEDASEEQFTEWIKDYFETAD